jgi:hypothetical protein
MDDPRNTSIGSLVILLGVPVFYYFDKKRRREDVLNA